MKSKSTIFFFVVVFFFQFNELQGQQTFNRMLDTASRMGLGFKNLTSCADGGFLIASYEAQPHYLFKLNSNLDVEWLKTTDNISYNLEGLTTLNNQNFILSSFTEDRFDIVELDSNGNFIRAKGFQNANDTLQWTEMFTPSPFHNSNDFAVKSYACFLRNAILRLNSNLDIVWAKEFSSSGNFYTKEGGRELVVTDSDNILQTYGVSHTFSSPAGNAAGIRLLNGNGQQIWNTALWFSSDIKIHTDAIIVKELHDHSFGVLVNVSDSVHHVITYLYGNLSPSGTINWMIQLDSSTKYMLHDMAEDALGNISICGSYNRGTSGDNGLLLKLNPLGAVLWAKEIHFQHNDAGLYDFNKIRVLNDNSIIIATSGHNSMSLAHVTSDGVGFCNDSSLNVTTSPFTPVVETGFNLSETNVNLHPVAKNYNMDTRINHTKENCSMSDVKTIVDINYFNAFPNPTTGIITIQTNIQTHDASFAVVNLLGQPVYTKHESNLSSTYTKTLDLSYLPAGVYFLEVIADGERSVKELVKE